VRLHRPAVIACSALLAIAAACSSFGSSSDTPAVDAGDAATPPPAPPGDDGGTARFCAQHTDASFCWSFDDEPNALQGPSLAPVTFLNSWVSPTLSDAAYSAPYSMEALLPASHDTAAMGTLVTTTVGNHFRCDLQVFIVAHHASVSANLVSLVSRALGPTYGFIVAPQAAGALSVTAKTGIAGVRDDVGNIPVGQWTAIALEVAIDADTSTVTGFVPGAQHSQSSIVDGGFKTLGKFDLDFGLTFAAQEWDVRVDDIVCNWD
jgi:hypothetical protein